MKPFANPELEREFQRRYEVRFLENLKLVLVLSAALLLLYSLAAISAGNFNLGHTVSVLGFVTGLSLLIRAKWFIALVRGKTQPICCAITASAIVLMELGMAARFPEYYAPGRNHPILGMTLFTYFGMRLHARWAALAGTGIFLGCVALQFALGSAMNFRLLNAVVITNLIGFALGVRLESYFRRDFLNKAEAERVGKKLKDLTASVIPAPVASTLSHPDEVQQPVADLAVLFSDLAGFTAFSRSVSPAVLVATLNRINQKFDAEADRLGIVKIKTLGDAAIYVSGLTGRPDTAALKALGARMPRLLEEANQELGTTLQIRVGLGRGSAITGVIGKVRRRFDVWGEAIEAAETAQKAAALGEVREAPGYGTAAQPVTMPTSSGCMISA